MPLAPPVTIATFPATSNSCLPIVLPLTSADDQYRLALHCHSTVNERPQPITYRKIEQHKKGDATPPRWPTTVQPVTPAIWLRGWPACWGRVPDNGICSPACRQDGCRLPPGPPPDNQGRHGTTGVLPPRVR